MGPESAPVLLTCGTLIDGTGAGPVRDAAVLIDAGRIAYAGSRHPVRDLRGIRVVDAPGKTVVPGLIDLHTHSTFDADMRVYVKNGVTAIRFAGLNQDAVVTLRDRVMRNEVPGPRIFSCGPMLDKAPPAYPRWTSPVNTPAEAFNTLPSGAVRPSSSMALRSCCVRTRPIPTDTPGITTTTSSP